MRRVFAMMPLLLIGTLPPAAVGAPLAHRETMPNGVRLLVAPRPAIPIVVVRAYDAAPASFDSEIAMIFSSCVSALVSRITLTPAGADAFTTRQMSSNTVS